MTKAKFTVDLSENAAKEFAEISGDWNPLHTDTEYAAKSKFKRNILHGAYSAGLISRLAGMDLPGKECLLHSLRLRFIAPIFLPTTVLVEGEVVEETRDLGRVEATVSDAQSGKLYVEAAYEFNRLTSDAEKTAPKISADATPVGAGADQGVVLVTGATGGIGGALLNELGERGLGVSRNKTPDMLHVSDLERTDEALGKRKLSAIVHCAWPAPDNSAFTKLPSPENAIDHAVAAPLRQIQALSKLLIANGTEQAKLILVGSTAAHPGRHNYRMPLYTLSKSMVPTLARILAMELAPHGKRCLGLEFDIVDGGMSGSMSRVAAVAHEDRSPFGFIPSVSEAAQQIIWALENESPLVSGSTITLSGGAIP